MKVNRRIIFPVGRPPKEEAMMDVRLNLWIDIVRKYLIEETKDGVQRSDQLYRDQMMGKKSIELKVRKG